jgi:hypothetical protein
MTKRKKIAIWVMGVIGALLALLLILMLLLPRIINLEPIKQRIIVRISREVGGELDYRNVDLSFFPRPRVIIHKGSLSIPGKIVGTLDSLKIYLEIFPLLRGNVRIAMLRIEAPEFKMGLPEKLEEKETAGKAFSPATIQEGIAPALALMASKAPGLVIKVDDGRLTLALGKKPIFWFGDIHGRISLPPEKLEIDLACNSNLWESISVQGQLDSTNLKGRGRIDLTHVKPQVLMDQLFPLAPGRVGDSQLNLSISFNMDGLKDLQAEVQGSLPYITLHQADKKLVVKGQSLKANFRMDEKEVSASLVELNLDYPRLTISGTIHMDGASPRVRVDLEGREVDIGSIREAALTLAGEVPDIQEIFEMVQGGKVPLITVNAQGSSMADLGKTQNIVVKGSVVDGKIILRGADIGLGDLDLGLEDVKADMVISRGILEAKNVEARLGNSWGREGILRLGLAGEDAPFHLEAMMEVDLAELPSLVKGLARDEAFDKELALIKEIRGSAVGKLVLGESTKSIKAKVDLSKCNLFARYERIPYPLKIKHGWQFFYDGNKIGVQSLGGTVGKSSFSQIDAKLSLEKTPYLEIISGKSSIFLGEIYPWLSSLEGIKSTVKDLKSLRGTVLLSSLGLKGPLSQPEKWDFRTRGEVKNLAVDSMLFPDPLAVTRARFEAIPKRLSLTDCETIILDASLRVSGFLKGYLEGLRKVDFTLRGNVGSKAMKWLSDLADLPPELRIRAPLSISRAHGVWDKNGRTSFSANLAVKDGPKISMDVLLSPEELRINSLLIKDRESNANFALIAKERELHLDFNGHLDKITVDKIFKRNEILTGRIDGDFEAHILLDHPMRSTAQGKLRGRGLGYPLELKIPLRLEDVSLVAKKNKLKVESALLTWGDSHLSLKGDMDFAEDEFLFDMDLSADGLEWERVEKILQEENQESGSEGHTGFWNTPIEGILRVRLGYFKYEKFTWRPVHAAISFGDGEIELAVTEANLCGISTTGTVKVSPEDVRFHVDPFSKDGDIDSTLACLLDKKGFISGNFNLEGRLTGQAGEEDLMESLGGNFEFIARDGRIYRFTLLSRVLGLLSATKIITGKLPDLGKEGFAYSSIDVKGALKDGKLMIPEGIMDGSSMEIAAQGEIDLIAEKIDLTLLVAPLKTVDFFVKNIPKVKDILKGTLVSIPVRVTGNLANPTVRPLSASAVGSELRGIMKEKFRLPIEVIQPLRPGKGEN